MISNAQYWLFMATAALGATVLARFGILGMPAVPFHTTAEIVASLALTAATLLALPAVLVVPWRHVQIARRRLSNMPLYAGMAVFSVLSCGALLAAAVGAS